MIRRIFSVFKRIQQIYCRFYLHGDDFDVCTFLKNDRFCCCCCRSKETKEIGNGGRTRRTIFKLCVFFLSVRSIGESCAHAKYIHPLICVIHHPSAVGPKLKFQRIFCCCSCTVPFCCQFHSTLLSFSYIFYPIEAILIFVICFVCSFFFSFI